MSSSPVYHEIATPPNVQSWGNQTHDSFALIVRTRTESSYELITILMRHGFTSAERPPTEFRAFLQHLRPQLVVAVVDPERLADAEILGVAARSGAHVLLLAPGPEGYARGLAAGADACLCDYDNPSILDAQIGALRRRIAAASGRAGNSEDVVFGEFRLETASRRLYKGLEHVPLTGMEFSVLAHLAENAGRTTSATELLHHITGRLHTEPQAAQTIKVYIRRLRQKFVAHGCSPGIIVTIRGYGYMMEREIR